MHTCIIIIANLLFDYLVLSSGIIFTFIIFLCRCLCIGMRLRQYFHLSSYKFHLVTYLLYI